MNPHPASVARFRGELRRTGNVRITVADGEGVPFQLIDPLGDPGPDPASGKPLVDLLRILGRVQTIFYLHPAVEWSDRYQLVSLERVRDQHPFSDRAVFPIRVKRDDSPRPLQF